MASLKIYYGAEKPYVAVGQHQVRLLDFAFNYRKWHSYAKDRATLRAVFGLEKRGALVVDRRYSMFKINDGQA